MHRSPRSAFHSVPEILRAGTVMPALGVFMHTYRAILLVLALAIGTVFSAAFAQEINLLPKYGLLPKNEAQKAADAKFLASIDDTYKGNRKKAAADLSARGWEFLRQENFPDAMRRFNQAWLIDNSDGSALWGMAAIQASWRKLDESLKLFAEAEALVGDDIDFTADYAKALAMAGTQKKNDTLLNDAFARFARVYEKAPQHTLNLQNWAIALYYVGNYAEAWKKVKLAEATPGRAEFAPKFVDALQSKMPRP
jgi:tetratricopeptide (TPR) repeat protein